MSFPVAKDKYPFAHYDNNANLCSICARKYYAYFYIPKCPVCGEFACPRCSNITHLNCDHFLDIPRIDTINGTSIFTCCIMCLTKAEIKRILQIPFNDLPLYINEKWVTFGAEEAYQARFSGEAIKIPVGNKYIAVKCINTPYLETC